MENIPLDGNDVLTLTALAFAWNVSPQEALRRALANAMDSSGTYFPGGTKLAVRRPVPDQSLMKLADLMVEMFGGDLETVEVEDYVIFLE